MNRARSSVILATMAATAFATQTPRPLGDLGSTGNASTVRPAQLRNVDIKQKLDTQIPLDLEFRTEKGETVKLRQLVGKRPLILALVYYQCPRLCTMELTGLLKTVRVLPLNIGSEYDILTVSFDPRDTPEHAAAKKRAYAEGYGRPGAAEGWHFLVGDKRNIERLTHAVGFAFDYDPQTDLFSHASAILVLTPGGRVSRYFYGIEYSPRDVRLALVEAANGKIGSPIDQILLYCFHYDPATGRYSMTVLKTIQGAAVLSILALGSFIVGSRVRERRRFRELAS